MSEPQSKTLSASSAPGSAPYTLVKREGGPMLSLETRRQQIRDEIGKQDYLAKSDLAFTLKDLARLSRDALKATTAAVVIWQEQDWSGFAHDGRPLTKDKMLVSRSLLDEARATGEMQFRERIEPAEVRGTYERPSIVALHIGSALVMPLKWWQSKLDIGEGVEKVVGACLYVHRSLVQVGYCPFDQSDRILLEDIANYALPILSALREQERSRERVHLSTIAQKKTLYELGDFKTYHGGLGKDLERLERFATAQHLGRTCITVLGPPGVGKSFLMKNYHKISTRKDKPFEIVDCTLYPVDGDSAKLGIELFGYDPGVYSGKGRTQGCVKRAEGGTLFIEEIGDLPLTLQGMLLRVIQERKYQRIGGDKWETCDVTIVAATNKDLRRMVAQGRFRQDLYDRLRTVVVSLSGIDDRPDDLPALVQQVLTALSAELHRTTNVTLSAEAMEVISGIRWSLNGNTRGLESCLRSSLVALEPTRTCLSPDDLDLEGIIRPDSDPMRDESNEPTIAPPPPQELTTPVHMDSKEEDFYRQLFLDLKSAPSAKKVAESRNETYRKAVGYPLGRVGLEVRDVLRWDMERLLERVHTYLSNN